MFGLAWRLGLECQGPGINRRRTRPCFFFVEYVITMPNMYARGILFGKMVLELGDSSVVTNEKNNLSCDVQFKTKVCRLLLTQIPHYLFCSFKV